MSNKIKLLIFDFDGTLARSKTLYFDVIYHALEKGGYKISRKQLREVLGLRLEVLLPKLGINNADKIKTLKNKINNAVLKKAGKLVACPNIDKLKHILQKQRCVLITNSISKYTFPFLEKHKLKFISVLGSDNFSTKQEAFKKLFKKFNLKPNEAVYIADRAQDVDVARDAGCKSLIISNACSWSSLAEIKRKEPDYLTNSLNELNKLF